MDKIFHVNRQPAAQESKAKEYVRNARGEYNVTCLSLHLMFMNTCMGGLMILPKFTKRWNGGGPLNTPHNL